MRSSKSILAPEFRALLRLIQIVAVFGMAYSVATLVRETTPNVAWLAKLYLAWFALSFISAQAIVARIKAGAVTLVLSTIVVMIAEIITGVATIGGASLGGLVIFVVVVYVRPAWEAFD